MQVVYNIGIFFFGFGLRIASFFNPKAKKWISGRKNYFKNLPSVPDDKEVIWFHCASLGEFDQGLPLMNRMKEEKDCYLLVTFFSPSGLEHYSKRQHKADSVIYLPLDTRKNAKRFIHYFRPSKAFFIKYEFWFNHIAEAQRKHVPVYNVSGIFRSNQIFFKWHGAFFRKSLRHFKWFFVQNEESLKLLHSIQIANVTVTGDSRYDRVLDNKLQLKPNPVLENFSKNSTVFIAGSTWPDDENLIIDYINTTKNKVIIAPHNIDTSHVRQLTDKLQRPFECYSRIDRDLKPSTEIIVLDTIGHLSSAYFYGTFAYVGGGFSGSLHNILEPTVFGLPVIFGPKHSKFPEALQFIDAGIGFSVTDNKELSSVITHIESNIDELVKKSTEFVQSNAGSTNKIIIQLKSNSK